MSVNKLPERRLLTDEQFFDPYIRTLTDLNHQLGSLTPKHGNPSLCITDSVFSNTLIFSKYMQSLLDDFSKTAATHFS